MNVPWDFWPGAVEAERARDAVVVHFQITNRHRHVQADLQHQMRLLLEPLRNVHFFRSRVEVNEDVALLEQSEHDVFLRGKALLVGAHRPKQIPSCVRQCQLGRQQALATVRPGQSHAVVVLADLTGQLGDRLQQGFVDQGFVEAPSVMCAVGALHLCGDFLVEGLARPLRDGQTGQHGTFLDHDVCSIGVTSTVRSISISSGREWVRGFLCGILR